MSILFKPPLLYTKLLRELHNSDVQIAGGKGASLGEMMNMGVPVPDGFVVLVDAFDTFMTNNDLVRKIEIILTSIDYKTMSSVNHASEEIRTLITRTYMSQDIIDEIMVSFKNLGAKFVAVRSSATTEDGQYHAWAGQLDSYLNVTQDDVIEKVRSCWASLFTARAIFYRFEKGLHTTKISVAVVIQNMVNAEKSGVAFSVHPVTQNQDQLIIEAGWGLGEAIVLGEITPDSYVVEKKSKHIIESRIGGQSRGLFRKTGGGNEWVNVNEQRSIQILSVDQIQSLSDIIMLIERHYGFPCDIEWAYENQQFFIVQSRPITTLINT